MKLVESTLNVQVVIHLLVAKYSSVHVHVPVGLVKRSTKCAALDARCACSLKALQCSIKQLLQPKEPCS